MENKFTIVDFVTLSSLISKLQNVTKPRNDHVDSIWYDHYWSHVYELLEKLNHTLQDQLITKEFIEDLAGKKIVKFEKVYDDNGKLTSVNVQPVQVLENIEITMTITPTGTSFEEIKQ